MKFEFKTFYIIIYIFSLFNLFIACSNTNNTAVDSHINNKPVEEQLSSPTSDSKHSEKFIRKPIIDINTSGDTFYHSLNKGVYYVYEIDALGNISNISLKIIEVEPNKQVVKKIYSWDQGQLSATINNEFSKKFIADPYGKVDINVHELIRQLKNIPKDFNIKIYLTAKIDSFEVSKTLVIRKSVWVNSICLSEESDINMKDGKPILAPYPTSKIKLLSHTDYIINSGESDIFLINVHNKGKDSNYQLSVKTKSNYEELNDIVRLIGKLAPDETRNVCLDFTIPKTQQTSDIEIDFNFFEPNGYNPPNKKVILHVKGKKPPVFQYGYYIADGGSGNSIGNNNGIIEHRESIDIYLSVKNIGEADAEKTIAKIKKVDPDDNGLILNVDEIDLGNIRPNHISENFFTISIQNGFKKKWIELIIVIQDNVFHSTKSDTVSLPVNNYINVKPISVNNQYVVAKQHANVYSSTMDSKNYLYSLSAERGNPIIEAIGEFKKWLKVRILNKDYGWLSKFDIILFPVSPSPKTLKTNRVSTYLKKPPKITVIKPVPFKKIIPYGKTLSSEATVKPVPYKKIITNGKTLSLEAIVKDKNRLIRISIYLNHSLLKDIKFIATKKLTAKQLKYEIPLSIGNNVIEIKAVNQDKISDNVSFSVYRNISN